MLPLSTCCNILNRLISNYNISASLLSSKAVELPKSRPPEKPSNPHGNSSHILQKQRHSAPLGKSFHQPHPHPWSRHIDKLTSPPSSQAAAPAICNRTASCLRNPSSNLTLKKTKNQLLLIFHSTTWLENVFHDFAYNPCSLRRYMSFLSVAVTTQFKEGRVYWGLQLKGRH